MSQGYSQDFNFFPRTLESSLVTTSRKNFELYENNKLLRKNINDSVENDPENLNDVENVLLRSTIKKADFALNTLDIIENDDFKVPPYLENGLSWLVNNNEK